MTGRVAALSSYPVKGLSALTHDRVALSAGQGFPGDRVFGFAKADSGFDPADPRPMPKDRFIVLLQHAALAGLRTRIDPASRVLSVTDTAGAEHVFALATPQGRAAASEFLTRLLALPEAERPVFVAAAPHRFTDVSVGSAQMMHAVSLINRASVRDLGRAAGADIDPARFRANIEVDGWEAWSELDLVGREVTLGGVSFRVLKRTRRCGATRVNPVTAERDLDILDLLTRHRGHLDMGIYMETLEDGAIALGDTATVR